MPADKGRKRERERERKDKGRQNYTSALRAAAGLLLLLHGKSINKTPRSGAAGAAASFCIFIRGVVAAVVLLERGVGGASGSDKTFVGARNKMRKTEKEEKN